jgi:hypothetical protein
MYLTLESFRIAKLIGWKRNSLQYVLKRYVFTYVCTMFWCMHVFDVYMFLVCLYMFLMYLHKCIFLMYVHKCIFFHECTQMYVFDGMYMYTYICTMFRRKPIYRPSKCRHPNCRLKNVLLRNPPYPNGT